MGWKLDDNTRSGIHYLVLGVLVVAMLALGNAALAKLHASLGPDGSFGHGYWTETDDHRMIVATTTLGERLAAGVLLAFAIAMLVGAVMAVMGRFVTSMVKGWPLPLGRVVFVVAFSFFAYAAFKLPCIEFVGFRDRHVILWERHELFSGLPWPGISKRIRLIPFDNVDGFKDTVQYLDDERVVHWVLLQETDGTMIGIGNCSPLSKGDTIVRKFAEQRARELNSFLRP